MSSAILEKRGRQPDLTLQIVAGLEQVGRNIDNLLREQALEHELSPLQIRVLLFIDSYQGPAGVSVLSRAFNLSKATVSVALKPMVQKKLVLKKKSAADSRGTDILLTDWGKQIAHVAGYYLEPLRKVIAHIPLTEKELMLKNLNGILGKLSVLNEDAFL